MHVNRIPKQSYKRYIFNKHLFLIILVVVTVLMALLSTACGSSGLTIKQVIITLIGKGTKQMNSIVFNIRLRRVATAIVAGIGLSSVGCAMQSILRNPLASSSTVGVSQGAAFGAAFAIIICGAGTQTSQNNGVTFFNPYTISACAFAGSMLSTFFIIGLSKLKSIGPETIILAGVALSAMFLGGTTLLQYFADDVQVAAVIYWTFGNLGSTTWREILIMSVVVLIGMVYFVYNRWNYNALQSGDETAMGLGVNTDHLRITGMIVCSFTSAVIVSYIGIINFIGLLSPHLVRRVIGGDYRYLLPASSLVGAILLLASDTVARIVVQPIVLPIGAITSFLGAPLFIYLLFRGSIIKGKKRRC